VHDGPYQGATAHDTGPTCTQHRSAIVALELTGGDRPTWGAI
jgi:hypothetical protein